MQIKDIINKGNDDLLIALSYLLDKPRGFLLLNSAYELSKQTEDEINAIENKLKENYPLQYALGRWEFYGLELKVDNRALIPRYETEILIEEILKAQINKKTILDIGTGTGAISLALGKNLPASQIIGIDIDDNALDLAKSNKEKLEIRNVDFFQSDLFSNIDGKFDIIVSNPPYINLKDYLSLDEKLYYEPKKALLGGNDGLYFYEKIIEDASLYLNEKGHLFFEIGYDQKVNVNDLLIKSDFKNIKIIKDYNGFDRVVIAQKG